MYRYWALSSLTILALITVGCGGGGGNGGGDGEEITVTIIQPSAGESIEPGPVVVVTASVIASPSISPGVKFYIDDDLRKTDTTLPYQYDWHTAGLEEREYQIKATAYDVGSPEDSDTATITVTVGASQFTVYAGDAEVPAGEVVTVSVYMSAAPSAPAGYQMTVEYDETKLELANGVDSVSPGDAVPAAPNHIMVTNTGIPGQIRVAIVGWDDTAKQIQNFIAGQTELLKIDLRATGTAGDTPAVNILNAPTPVEFWTAVATQIAPDPQRRDGTVTIQ